MPSAEDRRLRALRPAKPVVDPWRPLGVLVEPERLPDGRLATSTTLFLAGKECPFTCVFCDLWQYTTDAPTPSGAIPEQIRLGLEQARDQAPDDGPRLVKLYNASNFFDSGAVPPSDDGEVARLVADFDTVVVECHARLVGRRCFEFAERLDGRLEVAMGFETAHPDALRRLNKKVDLGDLRRASGALRREGLGLRAFLLLDPPFVPAAERRDWLLRSVDFALENGASTVWLIPMRGDSAELKRLQASGDFEPPTLEHVEAGFDAARRLDPAAVRLDTWDLEHFSSDPERDAERLARLRQAQLDLDLTLDDLDPTTEVDHG